MNGNRWIERVVFGIIAAMLVFWAQNLTSTQFRLVENFARLEERMQNHAKFPEHSGAAVRLQRIETSLGKIHSDIREITTRLDRE